MGYCVWADTNERNKVYHDGEWGVSVHDDRKMFEWFEFKENWYNANGIGEYISSLSNAAAMAGEEGYLIWGVNNDTHELTGTTFNYHQEVKSFMDPWRTLSGVSDVTMNPQAFVSHASGHSRDRYPPR